MADLLHQLKVERLAGCGIEFEEHCIAVTIQHVNDLFKLCLGARERRFWCCTRFSSWTLPYEGICSLRFRSNQCPATKTGVDVLWIAAALGRWYLWRMPKSASRKSAQSPTVMALVRAIITNDRSEVAKLIGASPLLARERLAVGATRGGAPDFYFEEINHYLFAGDTPLHAAAAGYRTEIARAMIKNGANPNALDKSGVAPLHRAVRQRCPKAVNALLRNGADVRLKNKRGSTPLHLAVQNTGRGGTGSPEAKSGQREIIELLLKAGAKLQDRDARGKTAKQCAQSDWIRAMF